MYTGKTVAWTISMPVLIFVMQRYKKINHAIYRTDKHLGKLNIS